MQLSNFARDKENDGIYGDPAWNQTTAPWVALTTTTALTSEAGEANEVSYTGYARPNAATASMGASSSGNKSNTAALSFGQRTDAGASVTAKGFKIVDASSGACNQYFHGMLASNLVFGITNPADEFVYAPGHAFANGDEVVFDAESTMPGGLVRDTAYFVVGSAADKFQVSATFGGSAINITSSVLVLVGKKQWLVITQNVNPEFPVSGLVLVRR